MLAVQPDNWRNRSIHADMESCSQKKLLNELDLKKHACREELWPGRGIARCDIVGGAKGTGGKGRGKKEHILH
jgi:hypothetical protein